MITKKEFLLDVAREVRAIKKHATIEEKLKLNIYSLNPLCVRTCLYGLMTGACNTPRAKELMDKCCKREFKQGLSVFGNKPRSFSGIRSAINGKYKSSTWGIIRFRDGSIFRNYDYLSVLEGYITLKGAKNDGIIAYLRGESKKLEL